MDTVKKCSKCKTVKDFSDFQKANKGLYKLQSYCKTCQSIATNEWRLKNREYVNLNARIAATKISNRYTMSKRAAKRRGIEFLLSLSEYEAVVSQPCIYCNNKLHKVTSGIGLDRLDNNKGYIANNVASCCEICNKIKNVYLSHEETTILIDTLLKLRNIV